MLSAANAAAPQPTQDRSGLSLRPTSLTCSNASAKNSASRGLASTHSGAAWLRTSWNLVRTSLLSSEQEVGAQKPSWITSLEQSLMRGKVSIMLWQTQTPIKTSKSMSCSHILSALWVRGYTISSQFLPGSLRESCSILFQSSPRSLWFGILLGCLVPFSCSALDLSFEVDILLRFSC